MGVEEGAMVIEASAMGGEEGAMNTEEAAILVDLSTARDSR